MPTTRSRRLTGALALGAALTLGVGACSSDSPTSTTPATSGTTGTTTGGSGSENATVLFDKAVQHELRTVGCYTGAVDGVIGPETDAAIVAFQRASGLEVDGELGPETASALKADAAAGKTVCGAAGSSTTRSSGGGSTTTTARATTTTASGGPVATCTANAIRGGLAASGVTIETYICSEGYAAGTYTTTSGGATTKFILKSENGTWSKPGQDPCGSASAGIPPAILEAGCA